MQIADKLGQARNSKQCRERWHNHLDPSVKKGDWTPKEDAIIVAKQGEFGNQWAAITRFLPGRTDMSVKNRWHTFVRSVQRKGRREGTPSAAVRAAVATAMGKNCVGGAPVAAATTRSGSRCAHREPRSSDDDDDDDFDDDEDEEDEEEDDAMGDDDDVAPRHAGSLDDDDDDDGAPSRWHAHRRRARSRPRPSGQSQSLGPQLVKQELAADPPTPPTAGVKTGAPDARGWRAANEERRRFFGAALGSPRHRLARTPRTTRGSTSSRTRRSGSPRSGWASRLRTATRPARCCCRRRRGWRRSAVAATVSRRRRAACRRRRS